jgi:ferredoxin
MPELQSLKASILNKYLATLYSPSSAASESTRQSFIVSPDELILEAAIKQGIAIPYSCRNGTCRTCISRIIAGDVIQLDAELCRILPQELDNNLRLLCMSVLKSDAAFELYLRKRVR